MQRISRDRANLTLEFNPWRKPLAHVEIGETVLFETAHNLALFKEINSEDDLLESLPLIDVNPCTGPVYVDEAEPGDSLIVEITDIQVARKAHACLIPRVGLLHKYTKRPASKPLRIEDGRVVYNENISVPVRPVLGTFGTTPGWPEPTIMAGPHPGNLDDKNATIGAKIHMPVFLLGALFLCGDVHAAQGDSETDMAAECDAEVTIKFVELVKGRIYPTAFVETPTHWSIPAHADTLERAMEIVAKLGSDFLMDRCGITREEAAFVLSAAADLQISQACAAGYGVTVRAMIPKDIDRRGRLRSVWD